MDNLIIRPAIITDCSAIARVQVDSYLNAYAGIFPPSYFENFTYDEQADDWNSLIKTKDKGDVLLVAASDAATITGYCLAKIQKDVYPGYDAEIIALHVHPEYRRQGIGRNLLLKMKEELQNKGCQSIMLWTLQRNPIRSWYEKIGGILIGKKLHDVEGWEIIDVAYGWSQLANLNLDG
jgi:ribosomal protein S18 acetylase RimI-like enzyme